MGGTMKHGPSPPNSTFVSWRQERDKLPMSLSSFESDLVEYCTKDQFLPALLILYSCGQAGRLTTLHEETHRSSNDPH